MSDLIIFQRLTDVLTEMGEAIGEQYKQNLLDSGRNASGKLYNSIKSQVSVNGMTYDVELNMENYWYWIENGRNPTTATTASNPPLRERILEWIRVKPVLPTPIDGKLPTEEQLAYLITRKIHREGFEGKPDLSDALDDVTVTWEQKIGDAMDADVLDCFDRIFALLEN